MSCGKIGTPSSDALKRPLRRRNAARVCWPTGAKISPPRPVSARVRPVLRASPPLHPLGQLVGAARARLSTADRPLTRRRLGGGRSSPDSGRRLSGRCPPRCCRWGATAARGPGRCPQGGGRSLRRRCDAVNLRSRAAQTRASAGRQRCRSRKPAETLRIPHPGGWVLAFARARVRLTVWIRCHIPI